MEWRTTENGKYRIESLSAATLPGAMKVIREVFPNEESVAKGTGLNEDPVAAEEASIYFADAVLYGVSLVAVEVATGEVASVALNKLFFTDHSEDAFMEIFQKRCTRPASQSLLEFLAIIDEKCNLLEECGVDCSLEILVLATDKRHRKQGLGMLLSKTSIDLAKKLKDGPVSTITVEDLGPDFSYLKPKPPMSTYPKTCQAMWTAAASQSIGKKLNFKVYCTIPFDQFVSGGKTYAERIGTEKPFAELAALNLYEN